MNSINFTSNNIVNSKFSPEMEKKIQSQESFGAIDKKKLEQDTVELKEKTEKTVKENFVYRILRNVFNVQDPKKFLKSVLMTVSTVAGLAIVGNKFSTRSIEFGSKVDDFFLNQSWYKNIGKKMGAVKNKVVDTLKKSKTLENVLDTLKNRKARPKCDMARGYGHGFTSIFALTPVDIIKKALDSKDVDGKVEALKKLVGTEKSKEFVKELFEEGSTNNKDFCEKFIKAIQEKHGIKSKRGLITFFKAMPNNPDFQDFTNVLMKEKGKSGIIGSWWPVNIIDSIGKAIRGDKWKPIGRGDLADSLLKFGAVDGLLADTKLGSLAQKSLIVPTESISNFVNDKSGMGFFLASSIMTLYNNVQDAPKDKKVATIADDYIGTIGSIAVATPLASLATYGLASLKNLDPNKGKLAKPLQTIGKFFGMGLDKIGLDGKKIAGTRNPLIRIGGGALRLILIMFVFSGKFQKPIRQAINKIFGKPYDPYEAQKEKEIEAKRKQIVPELGITQGEFEDKLKANPNAILKVQQDPQLARELQRNPKLWLDLLDNKEIRLKPKDKIISPLNAQFIRDRKIEPKETQEQAQEKVQDNATYIPSSKFVAVDQTISKELKTEIQEALQRSDLALKKAEQYL